MGILSQSTALTTSGKKVKLNSKVLQSGQAKTQFQQSLAIKSKQAQEQAMKAISGAVDQGKKIQATRQGNKVLIKLKSGQSEPSKHQSKSKGAAGKLATA